VNRIHCLKTWPKYYAAVVSGEKVFEIRKNDREFNVGDALVLQEFNPDTGMYTGEMITKVITYVSDCAPFLPDGFVAMSIAPYEHEKQGEAK
jgi:hypothetical protein